MNATADASPPTARSQRRVAIIGLGEVGRSYSRALVAHGHEVTGHDPYNSAPIEGVKIYPSAAQAVARADTVFVLTAASVSLDVARELSGSLARGVLYADFTSSAPAVKRAIPGCLSTVNNAVVADVAILGPVVKHGPMTPLMAAGPGANRVAELMRELGAPVEVVAGEIGDAMAHKLLRSVFMKSLAASVLEAVEAGRAAGFEPWIRQQIARELSGDGQATIERFQTGSRLHGDRRAIEMDAAAEFLRELGVDDVMTTAAAAHLRGLMASPGGDAASGGGSA